MRLADVRVAVLFIEGVNCEQESVAVFRYLGAQAEKVHLKQFTGDVPADLGRRLDDYDILFIPGGFAAGDYVRAGSILAARMRSRMAGDLLEFVRAGKPVLGVCNGFQVLVELGMLPAISGDLTETPEAVLSTNESAHYECRPSYLRCDNAGTCAFTRNVPRGRVLQLISSHAEGKFLLPRDRGEEMMRQLEENDQIPFRYVDDRGESAGYPWNPNGSDGGVAALCNREGNVFGIQPHPERAFFKYLHADWTRSSPEGPGDGQAIFQSVLDHVTKRF